MTDKKENINVVFKPKGTDNPSELRNVEFKMNKQRAEDVDKGEIIDIANRKAVDNNVISPRSSLKYWEVKEVQIGDDDNSKDSHSGYYGLGLAKKDTNSKSKTDKDDIGYYGLWV